MAFEKGHKKAGGRKKGTPNKTTTALREAILQAAELAGDKLPGDRDGLVKYLMAQAIANPQAFLSLLGKVLPTQVDGNITGTLKIDAPWLNKRGV